MQTKRMTAALYAAAGLGAVLVGGTFLLTAHAQKKVAAIPAPMCKISPVQAIKTALGKYPGRALNANFEFGEGKWVYGVMIVNGKSIKEVEVDPMTGKIGDMEDVTPDDEAGEMRDELNRAIGNTVHSKPEAGEKGEKGQKP